MKEWVQEAWGVAEIDHGGWEFRTFEYSRQNGFTVNDVYSQVMERKGPILLCRPHQQGDYALLRDRISGRYEVRSTEVFDSADLIDPIERIVQAHENGEPTLPRKLACAILLIYKLHKGDWWGGESKNKSFMWVADLAKGRGVDKSFVDIAPEVSNTLSQKGYLTTKPSQGKKKYALNIKRKEDIEKILRDRDFPKDCLARRSFLKDKSYVSTRTLDVLDISSEE